MPTLVKILAFFFILSGISLIVRPDFLLDWIQGALNSSGLYIAAILGRFLIGLVLVLAAKHSMFLKLIMALGVITMLAAVVFLLMGRITFYHTLFGIIDTLKRLAPLVAGVTIMVGGFLFYAFSGHGKLAR